jgi:probable phosphoglycerate mutase
MRILILRHGETEWNTCARLQGQTDIPLNENGIRLARITGEKMRDVQVDICYTSPLGRAKKTALLVLNGRDVPIREDARLTEIGFGSWEGRLCGKGKEELPKEFLDNFYRNPFSDDMVMPEDGETFGALRERILDFIHDLTADPALQDKHVLLSCHGCSSRALLGCMSGTPLEEDFWRGTVPPNCSVSVVDYENGIFTVVEEDRIYYDKKEWKNHYVR